MIKITLFSTPLKYCDTSSEETGRPLSLVLLAFPQKLSVPTIKTQTEKSTNLSKESFSFSQSCQSLLPRDHFTMVTSAANCKTSRTICLFYLLKNLHQIQVAIGHAPGGGMKLLCGLQGSLALPWASRTQNFKDYGLHPRMPLGLRQVGRAMLISQWGHGRSPCAHGSQPRHFPFPSS